MHILRVSCGALAIAVGANRVRAHRVGLNESAVIEVDVDESRPGGAHSFHHTGHCEFKIKPDHEYYWDLDCRYGGVGCMADGIHHECRFCGMPGGPTCKTKVEVADLLKCEFVNRPPTKYFWDKSCLKAGGKGCNADGKHMECRFCDDVGKKVAFGVNCPKGARGGPKKGHHHEQVKPAPPRPRPRPRPRAPAPPRPRPRTSTKAPQHHHHSSWQHELKLHLRLIDTFLDKQPRNANGLLQTYGPTNIGGGSCPKCKLAKKCPAETSGGCRHDVYDNALVAIYYTKRGKLTEAKRILDGFRHLLYPGNNHRHAHHGGPSGQPMTMLAAAYTPKGGKPGEYHGHHTSSSGEFVDTGNNAYAGIAFARYAAATGDGCASAVAHDIMHALRKNGRCDDRLGGFMGRHAPTKTYYRSVEHNIDMVSFARMIGDKENQKSAAKFVEQMWAKQTSSSYAIGTSNKRRCDDHVRVGHAPIPTDGTVWAIPADADGSPQAEQHYTKALQQTLKRSRDGGMFESNVDVIGNLQKQGRDQKYYGLRFSDHGNGIQWEITASGVVAMTEYKRKYGKKNLDVKLELNQARDSIKKVLRTYGSVPASILGGNVYAFWAKDHKARHPGGSDTGIGWNYMRYPHLAATVWSGFALMMQVNDDAPIDREANPYAKPSQKVPPPSKHCKLHPR